MYAHTLMYIQSFRPLSLSHFLFSSHHPHSIIFYNSSSVNPVLFLSASVFLSPSLCLSLSLSLTLSLPLSGSEWIEEEERTLSRYAQSVLTSDPRIVLLGRTEGWLPPLSTQDPTQTPTQDPTHPARSAQTNNLPIFSFLIRRGHRYLHSNFVCALLNDLFGIQARGKICVCERERVCG